MFRMTLQIERIPVLTDNYIWLAHDAASGATAVIDPAEAAPVLARLAEKGWRLSHILNTHHHWDHTGGNLELKAATGCIIVGAAEDAARIPGIDRHVRDGDTVLLGTQEGRVLDVRGHTAAHIAYHFAASDALFCGDTLFLMGCGRLIEGTPEQMWASLGKIAALPDATRIYCAHEYTLANARYAVVAEPENAALRRRLDAVIAARERDEPTVPDTLALERATNPFLRAGSVAEFARRRAAKDAFRG